MDSKGSHDIYEVKEIVGMKKVEDDYLYKVRWRGYGPENDTWEPESNFFTCHDVIEEYKSKIKSDPSGSGKEGGKSLRPRNKIPRKASPRSTLSNCSLSPSSSTTSSSSVSTLVPHKSTTSATKSTAKRIRIKSNCPLTLKTRSKRSTTSSLSSSSSSSSSPSSAGILVKRIRSRRTSTSTTSSSSSLSSSSSSSPPSSLPNSASGTLVKRITIKKEPDQPDIDVCDISNNFPDFGCERLNRLGQTEEDKLDLKSSPDHVQSQPLPYQPTHSMVDQSLELPASITSPMLSSPSSSASSFSPSSISSTSSSSSPSSSSPSLWSHVNCNLNQRLGADGKTPLIHAAEVGNVKLVQFLLDSGASKDVKDAQGNTALILACQNGHHDIVRCLLFHGANFSIMNNAGSSALRTAKLYGNEETQHILTKHVSQITMALEKQVIERLRSTARISHALFPIQCHSSDENLRFRLLFNFDSIEPVKPDIHYLLFISDSTFSLFKPVSLKFFSSSTRVQVYLNRTPQKSLTEGTKFVYSLNPLRRGVNELILCIKESESRQCFIICAYQVTPINAKSKIKIDEERLIV